MSIFLTLVILIISLFLGKRFFQKWFNPLSLYSIVWSFMLILYEVRLIQYYELTQKTWGVVIITFLLFLLGIITYLAARSNFYNNRLLFGENREFESSIFLKPDIIKKIILILSFLGMVNAIQHWVVLVNEFGSIKDVLIQANLVYRLRTDNEIKGVIPYLFITSYIGVFFAGIYSAIKNRFEYVVLLPILSIIIKEIASFGRAGILIAFFEFLISFMLTRHFIASRGREKSNFKPALISFLLVGALVVAGASTVKSFRGTYEKYRTTSSSLSKLKEGAIISPSVYLYLSAHVGVLNKYLDSEKEGMTYGEHTFQPLFNFAAKLGIIEKHPSIFQRFYFIPVRSNTGTYLREIHSDFGIFGLFVVPFLLGLISTKYWFKFYSNGKFLDLVLLVYINIMIGLSFLVMISRTAVWFVSIVFLIAMSFIFEKYITAKDLREARK